MERKWLLWLISIFVVFLIAQISHVAALQCSQIPLNITDLTNIVESTSACPTALVDDAWIYNIFGTENKGEGACSDSGFAYADGFETGNFSVHSRISLEGGFPDDILAGDSFTLSYDSISLEVFYPLIDVDGGPCDTFCIHYISTDGSTYNDSDLTKLAYGANGCNIDSCVVPDSGDWLIEAGDICTLNVADSITGNLNISNGSLEIQGSGALTVSGGFVYIYSGSNLTLLSGGQLNG